MSVLLQVSDTHFGTERPEVVRALIRLASAIRPAVVVLSGDITQRARRAQFRAAREFAEQLAAPRLIAIPGNHDIPLFNVLARAFDPYGNYQREFGANLEPEFESHSLLAICVNTTRPSRHKDGEISAEQVERVAARVRRADPGQLRIVVTHQPVHVVRSSDIANLLHGYEAAVRAWCEAGADVVLGGHIHLPYVAELSAHVSGLPRRIWAVQAGTAVSERTREDIPNSVNVLEHRPHELLCCVQRWDYQWHTGQFRQVEVHELPLARP